MGATWQTMAVLLAGPIAVTLSEIALHHARSRTYHTIYAYARMCTIDVAAVAWIPKISC